LQEDTSAQESSRKKKTTHLNPLPKQTRNPPQIQLTSIFNVIRAIQKWTGP